MSTPGTRTLAIIRAHEIAAQLCYTPSSCYAVLIALAEGSIDANRLMIGNHMQKNSAASVLRTLAKQNVFNIVRGRNGAMLTADYILTEDGKKLAHSLLS
jgi:predicted transcriptional regulator